MSDHSHAAGAEHQEESMITYVVVLVGLFILLGLTYGAYLKDFGARPNLLIAMVIAIIKASMVLFIFMHVRLNPKLIWIFALGSFLWLILMISGFFQDYGSRPMDTRAGDTGGAHSWINPEAAAMKQE